MIAIRRAMDRDLGPVLELAREFVTSYALDEEVFRASFFELVGSANIFFAVAEQDAQIVGYLLGNIHLTLYANGRVAWVGEIMVDASHRRQKLGEALMSSFEAWAKENGATEVNLATRRAGEFYLALGYVESATYFKKRL